MIRFRLIEPGSDKGGRQRVFSSACGGKEPTAAFDFCEIRSLGANDAQPLQENLVRAGPALTDVREGLRRRCFTKPS